MEPLTTAVFLCLMIGIGFTQPLVGVDLLAVLFLYLYFTGGM